MHNCKFFVWLDDELRHDSRESAIFDVIFYKIKTLEATIAYKDDNELSVENKLKIIEDKLVQRKNTNNNNEFKEERLMLLERI